MKPSPLIRPRDRIARAIVAEFPPRLQPDNDDFAEALRYADAALGVLSEGQRHLKEWAVAMEARATHAEQALEEIAEWNFGRYSPSPDEAEMVGVARRAVLGESNERGVVMERYPYEEGDVIVLGPEVFATKDYKVICWQGQNYVLAESDE